MQAIRDVLDKCQSSLSVHQQLLTSLKDVYDQCPDKQRFFNHFIELLRFSLVRAEKSAAVDLTLEFAARFARFLSASEQQQQTAEGEEEVEQDDQDGIEVHPLFSGLMQFLLDNHRASSQAVRFRSCQLLNKLLVNLGEDAYLDDQLCDRVYEAMLERLQDTAPAVRVQAVFALARLQDPADKQCPVIRAYMFHLRCDPHDDVRRAVLVNIGGSAQTLPAVLDRVRDKNAGVRRQAYRFLTKVHIKSLTIAQRRSVLKQGLDDRELTVRRFVERDLLQAWLRLLEGSLCQLLHCLYVELCPELGEKVVAAVCGQLNAADMVELLGMPADSRVFEADALNAELALSWRCVCERLRADGGADADVALERVTPDLPALCQLVEQLTAGDMDESRRFALHQLLTMAAALDLWEEFGRQQLMRLVENLLASERLPVQLVAPLVRLYERAVPDPEKRVAAAVEVISDVRAPLQQQSQPQTPPPPAASKPAVGQEPRDWQLRHARLRLRVNELRDLLDAAVERQDFGEAQTVKLQLAECQREQEQLELEKSDDSPPTAAADTADHEQEGECAVRDDPVTLCKCLELVYQLLQSDQLRALTDQLRALADSLVLPSIQSEESAVRRAAVRALSTLCLLNRQLAQRHLLLLMQVAQADESSVQLAAYQGVFDQLLVHGPQRLVAPSDDPIIDGAADDGQDPVSALLTPMAALLDSSDTEARGLAAEGLCKLLIHGRVSSARLLERLVLLWYNPITDDDIFLRNMLGVFFPAFASAGGANQELLAEAMLPALITLIQAPLASPLVEVDVDDVARFFVQLTRACMLSGTASAAAAQEATSCAVHETLAFRLLRALLDEPRCRLDAARRPLVRALSLLQLSDAAAVTLRQLLRLTDQLTGQYGPIGEDKLVLRHLDKFRTSVAALLEACPCDVTPAVTPLKPTVESSVLDTPDQCASRRPLNSRPDDTRLLLDTSSRRHRRSGGPQQAEEEVFLGGEGGGQGLSSSESAADSDEFSAVLEESMSAAAGGPPRRSHAAVQLQTAAGKRAANTPPARQHKLSRPPSGDKRTTSVESPPPDTAALRKRARGGSGANVRNAPRRTSASVLVAEEELVEGSSLGQEKPKDDGVGNTRRAATLGVGSGEDVGEGRRSHRSRGTAGSRASRSSESSDPSVIPNTPTYSASGAVVEETTSPESVISNSPTLGSARVSAKTRPQRKSSNKSSGDVEEAVVISSGSTRSTRSARTGSTSSAAPQTSPSNVRRARSKRI